jgi:hypothetical protein
MEARPPLQVRPERRHLRHRPGPSRATRRPCLGCSGPKRTSNAWTRYWSTTNRLTSSSRRRTATCGLFCGLEAHPPCRRRALRAFATKEYQASADTKRPLFRGRLPLWTARSSGRCTTIRSRAEARALPCQSAHVARTAKEATMASTPPDPKRDEPGQGAPRGPDTKGNAVPARPGTANKPAGKPANKGPLERPETA